MIGIYKIENLINHKKYIGQSSDIYDRWRHHKNIAKNSIYNNDNHWAIHEAICKYGVDNFSFEVIEECDEKDLNEREIYWIAYYHTWLKDPECWGYNMTSGGDGGSRTIVDQYDLQGNFIQTFSSIGEASNKTGISRSGIGNCINGVGKSSGGFQWRRNGEPAPGLMVHYRGHKTSGNNSNNPYQVNQYDKEGNYINTFPSAKDAAQSLNNKPSPSHISECCAGKRKSAYGYVWRYKIN